jgi:3-methyladenine DNA glycosylase/8-oxoguanine DNA glycosylase
MKNDFRLKIRAKNFNFKETILSHGWVFLRPFHWDDKESELNLKVKVGASKTVELEIGNKNEYLIVNGKTSNESLSAKDKNEVKNIIRHIFRLDEDFNGFYEICKNEPSLEFVYRTKSGRLLRSATIFEDVIKTICTTNCSWSNTKMMVSNLCDLEGGCFPLPETILKTGIKKLQKNCRVGYRGKPIYEFSKAVVKGEFKPRSLLVGKDVGQIKKTLISFNGIGKYSVNHILMLLGHYSEIPVDSEVTSYICDSHFNGDKINEKDIVDLFEKYGEWKFLVYKFQRIGRKLNYIN